MKYPAPYLLEVAIEPKTRDNAERLLDFLKSTFTDDDGLLYSHDWESGQTILRGPDEAEVEALVRRIRDEAGIIANVGRPQVAYRETITKTVVYDHTHKKASGPMGQYARVKIRFEALAPGSGVVLENEAPETAVPKEYWPGVEKGLAAAVKSGVMAGFPVIDIKATLIDGAYHAVDSSVITFDIAARACFREAMAKAGAKLLEPIMKVEVVTPEEYLGDVIGDLNRRRGQVRGLEARGRRQVVTAAVPLANMFGYMNDLLKMTQGHAEYEMQFERYEQVPLAVPDGPGPFGGAMALRVGARLA